MQMQIYLCECENVAYMLFVVVVVVCKSFECICEEA
jgi:hypothetical protein